MSNPRGDGRLWLLVAVIAVLFATPPAARAGTHITAPTLKLSFDQPTGWQSKELKPSRSWMLLRGDLRIAVHLVEKDAMPSAEDIEALSKKESSRLSEKWDNVKRAPVMRNARPDRTVARAEISYKDDQKRMMIHRTVLVGIPRQPKPAWCLIQAVCPRASGPDVRRAVGQILGTLRDDSADAGAGGAPASPSPAASPSPEVVEVVEAPDEPAPVAADIHLENVAADPKLSYMVCLPEGYDPKNRKYPAVIFMHPGGDGASYMEEIREAALKVPWVIACTNDVSNSLNSNVFIPSLDKTRADMVEKFAVDNDKFFLGGFSGGGMASYVTSFMRQKQFAGVISNCGLIHGDLETREKLTAMGLKYAVIFSGEQDSVVTPEALVINEGNLKKCGVDTLRITWDGGHDIAPIDLYLEGFAWLEERMGL